MHSRRDFVKSGALLATGAAVGLSGCTGGSGGGGADYVDWMYAPGAVGDRDHYDFSYLRTSELRDNREQIGGAYDAMKGSAMSSLGPTDVAFEDVEATLTTVAATVHLGSFDAEAVGDALGENGFREDDGYGDNAVYVDTERPRAFGVADDALIVATDPGNSRTAIETIVDANNGDEDRYVDENDDMAALVDAVGDRTYVAGGTHSEIEETDPDYGQFAGEVATGGGFTIYGNTTELRVALVFDAADDVATDEIRQWVDSDNFQDLDDPEVSADGRVATITGSAATEEFLG